MIDTAGQTQEQLEGRGQENFFALAIGTLKNLMQKWLSSRNAPQEFTVDDIQQAQGIINRLGGPAQAARDTGHSEEEIRSMSEIH